MITYLLLPPLLITSAIVGSVCAAEPDLRAKLEAQYAAMKAAMASRDAKALSALLAPEFVSVDASNQPTDADRMIQGIASLPTDPNKDSHTTLISIDS